MKLFWSGALLVMMMTTTMAADPDKPKIRTLDKGGFSGFQEKTELVVTNSTQWESVWKEHSARQKPAKTPPKVDFSKESVLFVSLGQKRSGGYAVEITAVRKVDSKTEVVVTTRSPKPGGIQLQALTAPFHIAAVPKISGPVKFKTEPAR